MVIFTEDRQQWTPQSRFIAAGRPDHNGQFRISGLPPGRYLAIAVDHLEAEGERDPELLARLKDRATQLILGEGESKTISLGLIQ